MAYRSKIVSRHLNLVPNYSRRVENSPLRQERHTKTEERHPKQSKQRTMWTSKINKSMWIEQTWTCMQLRHCSARHLLKAYLNFFLFLFFLKKYMNTNILKHILQTNHNKVDTNNEIPSKSKLNWRARFALRVKIKFKWKTRRTWITTLNSQEKNPFKRGGGSTPHTEKIISKIANYFCRSKANIWHLAENEKTKFGDMKSDEPESCSFL